MNRVEGITTLDSQILLILRAKLIDFIPQNLWMEVKQTLSTHFLSSSIKSTIQMFINIEKNYDEGERLNH